MLHNVNREEHSKILTEIASIVDAGKLTPVVDEQQFKLEDVGAAHDFLSSGEAMGKVVIEM